jgi:MFS family permease
MPQYSSLQYDTLKNKTFFGLLIAEFLAAFNDQCIHASAMFFAIRKDALTEGTAISLMPLLFYSPWALFATLSGFLADKLSKRSSLIFWKVAEVAITGMALLGFWLGAAFTGDVSKIGPWLVMSCVFLMGTHSAFYVPNKYGVLPEIFTVRMLSRANGLIESTTFLAIILGTTCGGMLSFLFADQEWWIGIILVGLALIGTLTSFLIHRMPPADPHRQFPGWAPWKLFKPLFQNLGVLLRGRLSSVAVLGLSFFTFMVAYMRATMYMYGQSQNPRWDEFYTSIIVAVVSLGVGVGSPLAGALSGGRVELGLVPIGALGMVAALVLASFEIFSLVILIVCLVLIGLFASFYLVPLYSMLQYSAPKGSKGASVATNNFVATTGAILASVVFFVLVQAARWTGLAEPFQQQESTSGTLVGWEGERHHPRAICIMPADGTDEIVIKHRPEGVKWRPDRTRAPQNNIRLEDTVRAGAQVALSTYKVPRDPMDTYYHVRLAKDRQPVLYNNEQVPRYLFLGAGILLFGILCLLCLRLPDFFLRTALWVLAIRKRLRVKASGQEKLTGEPMILATNCLGLADSLCVTTGTVRPVKHVLRAGTDMDGTPPLLRFLARRAEMIPYQPGPNGLEEAARSATCTLLKGNLVAVSSAWEGDEFGKMLAEIQQGAAVPVVPVYCDHHEFRRAGGLPRTRVRVLFGAPLPPGASAADIRAALSQLAAELEAERAAALVPGAAVSA